MAWLESHGNLARHPKTRRLMQRMGWTLPFTIGNLHLLWYWALEFAPTGDLTKFEPDQLTYDLDLGDATPEEFIEAMVEAGFIDRIGDDSSESLPGGESRRLHDWPEYTAKSLRPKFRRNPERWHQVLRSYGLPVPPRRDPSVRRVSPSRPPVAESTGSVGNALRAVRGLYPSATGESEREAVPNIPTLCSNEHAARTARPSDSISTIDGNPSSPATASISEPDSIAHNASATAGMADSASPDSESATAEIPKSLSGRRNFNDWWVKLQECYQNKGCPLTAYEQTEILAMLARNPFSAVEKLQYSVVNFETSYANLLTPKKLKSSVEHGPPGGSG